MTSTLAVTMPARQRDVVFETVLDRYAAHARALAESAARCASDRSSLAALAAARADLAEVDALLDLLGWEPAAGDPPVELVGPPALVRDIVRAAVITAARRLAREVERYERAEVEAEALRAAGTVVSDAMHAFLRLEASAP